MSTRSTIALQKNGKIVKKIYCHWDGYTEYNGEILYNNYNNEERVRNLLELGNLSSLGEYLSPEEAGRSQDEHSFKSPIKNVCVAYHRDRGETLEFEPVGALEEYNYIFDADAGEWVVSLYDGEYFDLEYVLQHGEEVFNGDEDDE